MWRFLFLLIGKSACRKMTPGQRKDFIRFTEIVFSHPEKKKGMKMAARAATIVAAICAIITLLLQVFA